MTLIELYLGTRKAKTETMVVRQKKHEDKIRQAVDIGNLLKYTDLQNKSEKVSSYLSLFCFHYKLIVFWYSVFEEITLDKWLYTEEQLS